MILPFEMAWSLSVYIRMAMLKSSRLFKNWQKSRNSLKVTPFSCLTRSSKRSKYMSYSSVSLEEINEVEILTCFDQSLKIIHHIPSKYNEVKFSQNRLRWLQCCPLKIHKTPARALPFVDCPWTCKILRSVNPDCLFCQRNALATLCQLCDVAASLLRPSDTIPIDLEKKQH